MMPARIKDAGGNAGSRIEPGEPHETIGRAGQQGYSLIIVGKHGRNWIEGKIIGTTAANVCETARRPGPSASAQLRCPAPAIYQTSLL